MQRPIRRFAGTTPALAVTALADGLPPIVTDDFGSRPWDVVVDIPRAAYAQGEIIQPSPPTRTR
jgi:hypothetical protein